MGRARANRPSTRPASASHRCRAARTGRLRRGSGHTPRQAAARGREGGGVSPASPAPGAHPPGAPAGARHAPPARAQAGEARAEAAPLAADPADPAWPPALSPRAGDGQATACGLAPPRAARLLGGAERGSDRVLAVGVLAPVRRLEPLQPAAVAAKPRPPRRSRRQSCGSFAPTPDKIDIGQRRHATGTTRTRSTTRSPGDPVFTVDCVGVELGHLRRSRGTRSAFPTSARPAGGERRAHGGHRSGSGLGVRPLQGALQARRRRDDRVPLGRANARSTGADATARARRPPASEARRGSSGAPELAAGEINHALFMVVKCTHGHDGRARRPAAPAAAARDPEPTRRRWASASTST